MPDGPFAVGHADRFAPGTVQFSVFVDRDTEQVVERIIAVILADEVDELCRVGVGVVSSKDTIGYEVKLTVYFIFPVFAFAVVLPYGDTENHYP